MTHGLTTTRNLRKKMALLASLDCDPVLSLERDRIEGYRFLKLMAFNRNTNRYDEILTSTIYNTGGMKVKKIATKKALYDFARKYKFEPYNVVIEGFLPDGKPDTKADSKPGLLRQKI